MLLLSHAEVCSAVTMEDAIEAMEEVFAEEGRGRTVQPARLNLNSGRGWLRLGPAVLLDSGFMGFKAMNLTQGSGVRYQVHLYRIETGELLAIMDAQHLTTLRTGATSAVASRRLALPGRHRIGVLGSGVEARAQAEAMIALGAASEVVVFSRNPANRERLAAQLRSDLGADARAVDSAREAVDGCGIVVAAVKSSETVLFGEWLTPGQHVNSVGTARRDQREIDPATFTRSAVIVVDSRVGVFEEAGDAVAARNEVSPDDVFELSQLVTGQARQRTSRDDITLFKSVGTAIQDIGIAQRIYANAVERGLGRELGEFPMLKLN